MIYLPAAIDHLARTLADAATDAVKTYRRNADTARAAVLLDAAYRYPEGNAGPYQDKETRKALLAVAHDLLLLADEVP